MEYVQDGMNWERYGTGWVYDIDRRLVVTNEHVVHGHDHLDAFLPQEVDGELQHDPKWYKQSGKKFAGEGDRPLDRRATWRSFNSTVCRITPSPEAGREKPAAWRAAVRAWRLAGKAAKACGS